MIIVMIEKKNSDTKSPFLLFFSCNSKRLSIALHIYIYQSTGNISVNIIVMIIASAHQTHTQEKQTTHALHAYADV